MKIKVNRKKFVVVNENENIGADSI